jgi:hypothetical protein
MTAGASLPVAGVDVPVAGGTATPLQTTTGGDPVVVLLALAALFVATALSLYLAARLYRGYRDGGEPGMAVLGVGLVLLTTVPMILRVVLATAPDVSGTTRILAVTASQLAGLLLILGVVYGGR